MSAAIGWRTCLGAVLLTIALSPQVRAQDDETEAEVHPIELAADERMPQGRSAFLQSEADATGDRYVVEGTQLLEPVSVGVYTQDPDDNVRVRVVKDDWDAPEREADTAGSGRADLHFRTYDGFKIWVTADEPTPYQLVVWVGDEQPAELTPAVVPASEYGKSAAGDAGGSPGIAGLAKSKMVWIGIVLLLIGGAAAAFWARRKRTAKGST